MKPGGEAPPRHRRLVHPRDERLAAHLARQLRQSRIRVLAGVERAGLPLGETVGARDLVGSQPQATDYSLDPTDGGRVTDGGDLDSPRALAGRLCGSRWRRWRRLHLWPLDRSLLRGAHRWRGDRDIAAAALLG